MVVARASHNLAFYMAFMPKRLRRSRRLFLARLAGVGCQQARGGGSHDSERGASVSHGSHTEIEEEELGSLYSEWHNGMGACGKIKLLLRYE